VESKIGLDARRDLMFTSDGESHFRSVAIVNRFAHCARVFGIAVVLMCTAGFSQPAVSVERAAEQPTSSECSAATSPDETDDLATQADPETEEKDAKREEPAKDADGSERIAPQFSEEIVVTARRVSERLHDVPASVSVYTAADLAGLNIGGFDDLRTRVPNLQYYDFNVGLPHFFVRGIGSVNRSGASDAAVGVFVDDVYIPRGFGVSATFFDMERIEVLRGPQGTLFGRNSVGGAIALHTRQPTAGFFASASADIGNNGRRDAGTVVNVPFSDRVFGRLAVLSKTYQGNALNTETGHHLEDEHSLSIRGSLKLMPTNKFTLLLSADRTRDEGRGNWWHLGAEGPFSIGKSNPDPRRGRNPVEGMKDRHDWGGSSRIEWETGAGALTSITAYRRHEYSALDNTTGLFVSELTDPDRFQFHHTLFVQGQEQTSRMFTQEVRWSSRHEGRVSWLGGLYYLNEDIERIPTTRYRFIFFNSEGEFGYVANNHVRSYAAFGQVEYRFQNAFSVAAGVRFTEDRKTHSSSTFGQHFLGFSDGGKPVTGWAVNTAGAWSDLTPAVSLRYDAGRDVSLYGTVSKGFKSGGFNDEGAEKLMVATAFGPETAWNYEIGVKRMLPGARGSINASVFHLDYRDLQVEQFVQPDPSLPPVEITTNAGKTTINGVELEWEARLVDELWLYGSYSHLNSEIHDIALNGVDISGNQLAYAPENKIYIGSEYALRRGRTHGVSLRVGFSYSDEFFGDIGNSDIVVLTSRRLVDAGVTWTTGRHWQIVLWGKNLTDQLYAVTATEVPVQDRYEKFGAPRQYGATLQYQF